MNDVTICIIMRYACNRSLGNKENITFSVEEFNIYFTVYFEENIQLFVGVPMRELSLFDIFSDNRRSIRLIIMLASICII